MAHCSNPPSKKREMPQAWASESCLKATEEKPGPKMQPQTAVDHGVPTCAKEMVTVKIAQRLGRGEDTQIGSLHRPLGARRRRGKRGLPRSKRTKKELPPEQTLQRQPDSRFGAKARAASEDLDSDPSNANTPPVHIEKERM